MPYFQDTDGEVAIVAPSSYVTLGGLAAVPDGSDVVGDYGFAIDRIRNGAVTTIVSFGRDPVPGVDGGFGPSGVAADARGEIYATTDGVNGGAGEAALIAIDADGQVHLLATGTPKR